ncbi:MAG: HXXEE domain-containing protein, partial [Bacteroidetes bacterium]|nr:HXXEE domain-containing protein [Bacteroidota bacterium]
KTPVDPQKIIVPYLLSVILFIAHVYEEYITDFEGLVSDISGVHVLERDFLTVAAFIAPVLWLVGAVLLLKRTDIGYYLLSFFFVGMTVAELSHFVFPFLEDGTFHYTSGMYTAALPLIPAAYGLYIVVSEIKKQKQTER